MLAPSASASRRAAFVSVKSTMQRKASTDFALFGPTCDSADRMRGPFRLPADTREGDWIELDQLGAYGACLRTRFNGFEGGATVEVADPPLLTTPGYDG